jgi:hypothetical protein
MSVESVIEKFQRIIKEKETQRSEHRQRQEEEVEVLRKERSKRRVEKSRECQKAKHLTIGSEVTVAFTIIFKVRGKRYHEKMEFVHYIIQDIYKLGTSIVEFL